MITQYASPVVVNPSQNFWLEGDGVTVSSNIAVPSLDLNFLTGQLPSNVTFTRADTTLCASYFDSTGTLQLAVADEPRFDYDPSTAQPRGFLIEESRTNLLLFSDAPATQSVTVSATAYTLSFYGTGTVTLSGVATATVVGTGAFPARTTYTFTPTAGSLTLTITGTVEYANLEAGAFATSWIATTASPATRAADVASVTTLSPWFNATEGSMYFESSSATINSYPFSLFGSSTQNRIFASYASSDRMQSGTRESGVFSLATTSSGTAPLNTVGKGALSYKVNDGALSWNGAAAIALSPLPTVLPNILRLDIGNNGSLAGNWLNGHIRRLTYYPRKLSSVELQAITA